MKLPTTRAQLVAIAVAIAALLSAFGLLETDTSPPPAPTATATFTATVTANLGAQSLLPAAFPDTHMAQSNDLQAHIPVGAHAASATPEFPGCISRPNTHNFSTRRSVTPRAISAHYTVSRNVTGWSDVNAIDDFLNRTATAASSDFIIDAEGNCLFVNPAIGSLKAWTEMAGNPFTVAIEFVAYGDEGKLSAAAIAKGGLVVAELAARFHIPIQLGDVTGCTPRRAGIVDHAMYGACGGGHHDLRPFYGSSVVRRASDDSRVLGPLIAAARSHSITRTDIATCRKLNWWRAHGRPHGKAETNAVRRRKALASRGVTCKTSGPVKSSSWG